MWQYSIIPQGLIEGGSMGMIKVYAHIARKIYSLQKTDRDKGINKPISAYCTEDLIFYISNDTGLKKRMIINCINQLVKQGHLKKTLKGKSNLYSINGESGYAKA